MKKLHLCRDTKELASYMEGKNIEKYKPGKGKESAKALRLERARSVQVIEGTTVCREQRTRRT